MMVEPHAMWIEALVKDKRTKRDFADCLTYLLEEKYSQVANVRLVLDHENTLQPLCMKRLSLKKHSIQQNGLNGMTHYCTEAG
jgi:hypothetical protein